MPKHITFEKKKEIVEYYKQHIITVEECAKIFNVSMPSIGKILKEFKIKPYSKAVLFSPELNEHYFDEIDSPQKAYWLGLIMTDGCVHVKKNGSKILCLTLKSSDDYLLKSFMSDIKCNKKIVKTEHRTESSIQISSNIMCDSLAKYGITERKTGHEKFICPAFKEAYLRGLIDGDGSISFYARPNRNSHVKSIRLCCSNKEFLEDIINYIGCGRIEKSHEGLWTITWSSNDNMMRVVEAVEKYDTIHLTRKIELMNKIVEEIRTIGKYRDN